MRRADYIIATYQIEANDPHQAITEIIYGQSIGNPTLRTPYDSLPEIHKHIPTYSQDENLLTISFPFYNFDRKINISHMLSVLMGGQTDIDNIRACRLIDLNLSGIEHQFPGPRYGIKGIRELLGVYNRPLIGGIIKPKIGLNPSQIAEVAREMALGGCDFIKEDEILSNQQFCPLVKRIPEVVNALKGLKVIYAPSLTADGMNLIRRAVKVERMGISGLHVNLWAGLGSYLQLRQTVKLPIFFQKSGEKVLTIGPYSIDYAVICKFVNLMGCDFAHVGMSGGYLDEPQYEIKRRLMALKNTIPSFSCGARPELVKNLVSDYGIDIMISSGGYIASHPDGPRAGAKAMREAAEDICASTNSKT